jgi:hypothetical protein
MKPVDFFIVGAPKCGTTAMYSYLKSHPQVFFPERKEPHLFGTDLEFHGRPRITDAEYQALYRDAEPDQRWGDASVFYLVSAAAAQEIKEYNPKARIIIMLRNPVDVMHSFHSQRLFNGTEDIESFEEAVNAEFDRGLGRRLPPRIGLRQGLFYRDLVRFGDQVARYLAAFDREQVHILIYEDFVADISSSYKALCGFLEIDTTREPVFEKVNVNKVVRFPWLRDILHTKPKALSWLGRTLVPSEAWRESIRRGIFTLNMASASRTPVDPAFRAQLRAELAPSIERLEELIQLDLSHWRGA